jgi:hypothetical protein
VRYIGTFYFYLTFSTMPTVTDSVLAVHYPPIGEGMSRQQMRQHMMSKMIEEDDNLHS